MLRCVIIDDEQSAIDILERYIARIPGLQLVATSSDSATAGALILQHDADVVFLDIQMDDINGLELAASLPSEIYIIFCTAHSEFAVDSYNIGCIDYLLKPIPFDRFVKAVERLSNFEISDTISQESVQQDYFFVKTELKGKIKKIELDELDYVEARNNYVAFHLTDETILTPATMKQTEQWLPKQLFARIHKSFIVSLKKIAMIESGQVIMKSRPEKIPIGDNYKSCFLEQMKKRLM